jgi:hypothetical protein
LADRKKKQEMSVRNWNSRWIGNLQENEKDFVETGALRDLSKVKGRDFDKRMLRGERR